MTEELGPDGLPFRPDDRWATDEEIAAISPRLFEEDRELLEAMKELGD